jgi:hypothetical protein
MTHDEARGRLRQCTTKTQYIKRKQAKDALALMNRRGRLGMVVYNCPYCGRYHIGHPKKPA